jgi:putative Holliday junction resolvase
MQFVPKERTLAIDYGERNIGLACSDELGLVVRPLPSLACTSRRAAVAALGVVVAAHSVRSIVVGMPWNMDGSRGSAVERVEAFMDLLARELAIPLDAVDERLSTVEAAELWQRMNRRQRRKYRTMDSLAAALILQRYLEDQ